MRGGSSPLIAPKWRCCALHCQCLLLYTTRSTRSSASCRCFHGTPTPPPAAGSAASSLPLPPPSKTPLARCSPVCSEGRTAHPGARGARGSGGSFSCSACRCGGAGSCCCLFYLCLGCVRCSLEGRQDGCPAQGCCCRERPQDSSALEGRVCAITTACRVMQGMRLLQHAAVGHTAPHRDPVAPGPSPTGPVRSALLQGRHS